MKKISGRQPDISNELTLAKNLIVATEGLEIIKFFDNKGRLVFSTLNEDKNQIGALITFNSTDNIEKRNDFFYFKDARPGFLFDPKNNHLILKINVNQDNNAVGLMLFYLKEILTEIIRNYNYIDFKKPYYINSNIILLYKPDEVPEDYLFNFTLDKNKLRIITFKDKSGNEIQKTYRLFFNELKDFNLILARFVDNQDFIMNTRNQAIYSIHFFSRSYLLVLTILLFRKNEIDKLKEKSILFSISIFDEIIKAKTKEELENLHSQFKVKKENFFQDIVNDLKKIKNIR